MKLAYILNTYPQRSHSFIRREIAALERQGMQVFRFAMRPADGPLVDPLDLAEADKTEHVLTIGALGLFAAMFRTLCASPRLWLRTFGLAFRTGSRSDTGILRHLIYFAEACHVARRCADEGVGHLHAHFGTNAATVAMLAGALSGRPYSFTVHGPEEFDKPQALCLDEKMRRAAFTVAISHFGRSQLCRWVEHPVWPRIKVVHCGIEPAAFADPAPLPGRPTRIVAIGRFVEQKGHLGLIDAMAKVAERAPEVQLVLVGDGEMRAEIEAAIDAKGLRSRIEITGWADETRVRAELAAAHALVMPSFAEGLPMVVMEAMAAARPVIATYIAGTPELVQSGETGWLVPAGDAQALADAICQVEASPITRLQSMGEKARARVLQRHDVDVEAAKLAKLFASRLNAPAPIADPSGQ